MIHAAVRPAIPCLSAEQLSSLDSMHGVPPPKPCCKMSTNMAQLVDNIGAVLSNSSAEELLGKKDCVIKLLENAHLPEAEWSKYAMFSRSLPYTRNMIATDGKTYTLLLLCWNPNIESKIHDHPCEGCYVKVLKSSIKESRYSKNDEGEISLVHEDEYFPGSVTYMHDSIGLHKIGNPNADEGAITLHLYTPPYKTCKVRKCTHRLLFLSSLPPSPLASSLFSLCCSCRNVPAPHLRLSLCIDFLGVERPRKLGSDDRKSGEL